MGYDLEGRPSSKPCVLPCKGAVSGDERNLFQKKQTCFLYFGRDPSGFGAVISSIFMRSFIVFCN